MQKPKSFQDSKVGPGPQPTYTYFVCVTAVLHRQNLNEKFLGHPLNQLPDPLVTIYHFNKKLNTNAVSKSDIVPTFYAE